jgi:hypothetical protein
MAELFANGSFVDLILLLVAIEAVVLVWYWRARRRGIAPMDLLPNLFAGAFLLLALRLALGGANWALCCASLAAAGLAHVIDVGRRWR